MRPERVLMVNGGAMASSLIKQACHWSPPGRPGIERNLGEAAINDRPTVVRRGCSRSVPTTYLVPGQSEPYPLQEARHFSRLTRMLRGGEKQSRLIVEFRSLDHSKVTNPDVVRILGIVVSTNRRFSRGGRFLIASFGGVRPEADEIVPRLEEECWCRDFSVRRDSETQK